MTTDKLKAAVAAIRAGDKVSGRKILSEIVKIEPSNETAWLWLSACVDDVEQKKYCLTKALSINPDNANARKALSQLETPTPQPSVEDIAPNSITKPIEPERKDTTSSKPVSSPQLAQKGARRIKPVAKKNKQAHLAVWIIVGIFGVILVGGLFLVTAISLRFVLNPTPTLLANINPTLTLTAPPNPTSTILLESTPTKVASTNTPKPALACQPLAQDYLDKTSPLIVEFGDTIDVAEATSRIALGTVIQDMQKIARDVAAISAPTCAQGASDLIVNGMDSIISAFIDFMGDVSDTLVQRKFSQGILDLTNGTEQLVALASGKATPVPKKLPTNTPIPTPLPTPTPLPIGSSIVINDNDGNPWQIKVTRVLVADTLKPTFSDSVEKASGRFAIVFMEVTNRGLSPETFISFGTLDVKDASGQRFEENPLVSFYAQDTYDTDICADINPDETKSCVSVFDVSKQSDFYLLVPGALADSYAPRIFLDLP